MMLYDMITAICETILFEVVSCFVHRHGGRGGSSVR